MQINATANLDHQFVNQMKRASRVDRLDVDQADRLAADLTRRIRAISPDRAGGIHRLGRSSLVKLLDA